MPASSGKIRGDANSLKNQPLAIDACIISKPSAVIATVRRPNGNSDTALIPKRMIASGFYEFTKHGYQTLKNPRAALTPPGGVLIVAIVKQDQNPN